MGRPRLTRMPALDGLRALSILIILVYHGGAATIPGGFLSVDIFFVLSGFLITSLLLAEWERHGSLNLRQFWIRRARRLLPALMLVVGVVLVAGIVIVGHRADVIRADAIASLAYVSNWWFVAEGTSYFDQFNDPSPLRHMWSLSIEEQWYLLLPLVLVVVLPRLRSRRVLGWTLVGLGVASAIWMAVLAPAAGGELRPGLLRHRYPGASAADRIGVGSPADTGSAGAPATAGGGLRVARRRRSRGGDGAAHRTDRLDLPGWVPGVRSGHRGSRRRCRQSSAGTAGPILELGSLGTRRADVLWAVPLALAHLPVPLANPDGHVRLAVVRSEAGADLHCGRALLSLP